MIATPGLSRLGAQDVQARPVTPLEPVSAILDPPIAWDSPTATQDRHKWMAMRDRFPAGLIDREVLGRAGRALIVYGDGAGGHRRWQAGVGAQRAVARVAGGASVRRRALPRPPVEHHLRSATACALCRRRLHGDAPGPPRARGAGEGGRTAHRILRERASAVASVWLAAGQVAAARRSSHINTKGLAGVHQALRFTPGSSQPPAPQPAAVSTTRSDGCSSSRASRAATRWRERATRAAPDRWPCRPSSGHCGRPPSGRRPC